MGAIYEDFVRELGEWRVKYRGRPEDEKLRLSLLALEREQIVAVAYAEERLLASIDRLPAEARSLARGALAWAWRDEQMHAVYIRGSLLRPGSPALRVRTLMHQFAGAVAGWATSVLQHAPRGKVRLARAAASTVAFLGVIAGKVPQAMRGELGYRTFREFCATNVDAERTAAACWDRLLELGRGDLESYRRMRDDEKRHEMLFAALEAAFEDSGAFRPGESAGSLEERIGAIGPAYLAAGARVPTGPVLSLEGPDKRAMLRKALEECGTPELAGRKVAIKTTFMLGYHRKDPSTVIDPALLEELARWLRERGAAEVSVIEGPNIYDRFFARRSVAELASYFGLQSPLYRLVDASAEQKPHAFARGLGQSSICRAWAEADVRISLGKLRSHPCSLAYLGIENLEGLGARVDDYLFAERQADRATPVLMVLDAFAPHLSLLDAYEKVPDGLAGMMGCPAPRSPMRIYASRDPLALDLVVARHVGIADPRRIPVLRAACHWVGDPSAGIEVRGTDAPIAPWRGPYSNNLDAFLSFFAYPVYAYGSGRGAVFMPEMDEEAFPPLGHDGHARRLLRRGLQSLLGLRFPA